MPLHPPHIEIFVPQQSRLLQVGMWWRVGYGFLRIVLGVAFLRLVGQSMSDPIYTLMSHELMGRTGDAILEHLYNVLEIHDITVTYFIAGYFIFWGITDVLLSLCILHKIRQAFPITMGLIALFIAYSIYRFSFTHSLILFGVIIADFVILYLIHREYKKLITPTSDISTPSDLLPHQS